MAKTVNGSGKSAKGKKGADGGSKPVDGKEPTGVRALRGNGYDPDITQEFVDSIEDIQDKIDDIMEAAKAKATPLREEINDIKKEAHDDGLPRRELNAVLSKRRAIRRIEDARAKLSEEQQDNYDQIESALGMLGELGSWAADKLRGTADADKASA